MSAINSLRSPFLVALMAAGFSAIPGCAGTTPGSEPVEPVHSAPAVPGGEKGVSRTRLAQGDGDLDQQADDYAKRLAAALAARNGAGRTPSALEQAGEAAGAAGAGTGATREGGIEWVDEKYLRVANLPVVKDETKVEAVVVAKSDETTGGTSGEVKPADGQGGAKPPAAVGAKPQAASVAEREALVKQIRDRVMDSHDAGVQKAMSLAALALVDPAFRLDENELSALPPTQRELVRQFHELFSSLGTQVASGQPVDRHALGDRLNTIIGEQPLKIRTIKLCERVRSFGVYEELPGMTFLAGREHPMVVYVELDHFKSVKSGTLYEVKLSQELVLYNESDGLAVWRQPEQQIVDESRNQRRDFYVVQPTRLPARLGVGRFVLKIRVRDLHGGTRDEVSLPVNIVADPALVKPDARRGDGKAG